MNQVIKTDFQEWKEKRDMQLYAEWLELTSNPENSRTAIGRILMKKYNIGSTRTLYAIINSKEKELEVQG